MMSNEIIQYVDGELELNVAITPEEDTVWLTQSQMGELFGRAASTINEHIKNIYKSKELSQDDTMTKFGNSEFSDKPTYYYNLDVIISVGYRVKSKRGIAFRKWATNVLKQYMIQGYAINEKRLAMLQRKVEIQNTLISGIADMAGLEAKDILEVIENYSKALDLLDDYDHQRIQKPTGRETIYYLTEDECKATILKTKFSKQSELFGKKDPKVC